MHIMDLKSIVKWKKSHIYLNEIETRFHLHEVQLIDRKVRSGHGSRGDGVESGMWELSENDWIIYIILGAMVT